MFFADNNTKNLLSALEELNYSRAYSLLRKQTDVLTEDVASACLTAALRGSAALFKEVLSRCEDKKYGGSIKAALPNGRSAHVFGTMLTLAAALDRPEHIKLLLKAGYDINSASTQCADAAPPREYMLPESVPGFEDKRAVFGSKVVINSKPRLYIRHATPLAVAIACGSTKAAALLARQSGVWKADSSGVCRAAVYALLGYKDLPQQAAAGIAFGVTPGAFSPEEFISTRDIKIEHSADFCTTDMLSKQLEAGFCDENRAEILLGLIGDVQFAPRDAVRARKSKLAMMEKHYPQLCSQSRYIGIFLKELAKSYSLEHPQRKLMERYKNLCGDKADLSAAAQELFWMPTKTLRAFLGELDGMELSIDTDALCGLAKEDKSSLIELLSHVKLRHNRGLYGVSPLTGCLAASGDMRYLRKAAQLGAFAGDDPKELLKYLSATDRNHLRPLILTYGGKSETDELPPWKTQNRSGLWHRIWHVDHEEYEKWLFELANTPLSEDECLRRITMMQWPFSRDCLWHSNWHINQMLLDNPRRSSVYVSRPEAAILCGTQLLPLEMMLERMPERLNICYHISFEDCTLPNLEGTPLALAAATGRTQLVQAMLNSGMDPDEIGRGAFSRVIRSFAIGSPHITPIMAAIIYGEEETARLLLSSGAKCDFSQSTFQDILRWGGESAIAVASKLPNVGFESVPQSLIDEISGGENHW